MIIFMHQLTGVLPLDAPQLHRPLQVGVYSATGLPNLPRYLGTYLPLPVLSIMSKGTAC